MGGKNPAPDFFDPGDQFLSILTSRKQRGQLSLPLPFFLVSTTSDLHLSL